MPRPAWTGFRAASLLASVPLLVRQAGVQTPRLERALARFLGTWNDSAGPISPDATPVELQVDCKAASGACPQFGDDESYRLHIDATRISLDAPAEWGVLHALGTLAQLAIAHGGLPLGAIDDQPRFAWRGLTLDVARHFIDVASLLRTLDGMAFCKLNVLHLHLSDDQAFRFPSQAYPRLVSSPAYSRDDLARVVAYAAERGIRVVPELDVPGHTTCWLTAYPDWGCRPVEPSRRFGVHRACLDPTRPAVLEAVRTLFTELADVFPDAYLHFGGDEVHPDWWSTTPAVRSFMAAQGLATAHDLQAWFNRAVVAHIVGLGRRPLGWDEVLHPDLPAAVTVQCWRGATARDRALEGGHDTIVSANYYLDLFYPAELHYGFDPAAPAVELLAREDAIETDPRLAHVAGGLRWTRQWRQAVERPTPGGAPGRLLGASACLWAELVDADTLDVRLWSRLPALAERFWSPAIVTGAADLRRRLDACFEVLRRATAIDVLGTSRALMERAGVTEAWWPLVDQLEPVKWYARLLGVQALAARLEGREMPLARPYDADTPLDRVADGLLPEAPGVAALDTLCRSVAAGDADARAALRALGTRWCELPARGAGPAELEPLAVRLAGLGTLVVDLLDGRADVAAARRALEALAHPIGEYLLAPVPVLARWLDELA